MSKCVEEMAKAKEEISKGLREMHLLSEYEDTGRNESTERRNAFGNNFANPNSITMIRK